MQQAVLHCKVLTEIFSTKLEIASQVAEFILLVNLVNHHHLYFQLSRLHDHLSCTFKIMKESSNL